MDTATSNNQGKDLTSIMTQVENLQKQLAVQATELKDTRDREENARKQVDQLNEVNSKLTEAKREAMKQDFNNVVQGWIRSMDPKQVPEALKDEFLEGVEKFVDKGNESGIWKVAPLRPFDLCIFIPHTPLPLQVVCCASSVHQNQVNAIQKLTDDYNELKKTVDGGQFNSEESRKRKEMEPPSAAVASGVWEQLEGLCKSY
jgi:DNA repair exonuclease SbcCD ATPase subunit